MKKVKTLKIKTVCQRCGETLTVDLNVASNINGWIYFHVNELLTFLPVWSSWDVWFCGLCWYTIEEIRERLGEDTYDKYLKDLFQIEDKDVFELNI